MTIKTLLSLFFCFSFLSNFAQQNTSSKSDIIELPLTIKEGYSGLARWTGKLDWGPSFRVPAIEKTKKAPQGIPENWESSFVNYIFLDYKQFMYQNVKAGKMTATDFSDLVTEPSQLPYTDQWIHCAVSIAAGKIKDGTTEYIIDTNHNNNFSDEKIYNPQTVDMADITSKEISAAPFIHYQLFLNGDVVNFKERIVICEQEDAEFLTYNIPYFYQTQLNKTPIYVSSGFTGPTLEQASLKLTSEISDNPFDAIEIGNIIEIEGRNYKNLGVDVAKNVLRLERLKDNPNMESPTLNFMAPNFKNISLFDSENTISLSNYKGKYLFLEFWGSWCGPCIEDIPDLKEAYAKTDRSQIEFLSIAFNDQPQSLRNTIQKKELKWPQIFDNKNVLKNLYNVTAAPSSFLIDPNGKIIAVGLRGAQIRPFLDKIGF